MQEDIQENRIQRNRCYNCLKSLFSFLINCIALITRPLFSIEMCRIYLRIFLESFMGVLLVAINEIKTYDSHSSSDGSLLLVTFIILLLYLGFYVLVWIISFKEYKRRGNIERNHMADGHDPAFDCKFQTKSYRYYLEILWWTV